jgi:hypothetical protein
MDGRAAHRVAGPRRRARGGLVPAHKNRSVPPASVIEQVGPQVPLAAQAPAAPRRCGSSPASRSAANSSSAPAAETTSRWAPRVASPVRTGARSGAGPHGRCPAIRRPPAGPSGQGGRRARRRAAPPTPDRLHSDPCRDLRSHRQRRSDRRLNSRQTHRAGGAEPNGPVRSRRRSTSSGSWCRRTRCGRDRLTDAQGLTAVPLAGRWRPVTAAPARHQPRVRHAVRCPDARRGRCHPASSPGQ